MSIKMTPLTFNNHNLELYAPDGYFIAALAKAKQEPTDANA